METGLGATIDRFRPLPKPEAERERFSDSFSNLSEEQIGDVVEVVISQVKESRKFGLYISTGLLKKEERFFLSFLDLCGGVEEVFKENTFEEVSRLLTGAMDDFFGEEKSFFFEKFKKSKSGGSKNRYSVHLSVTGSAILNKLYNSRR